MVWLVAVIDLYGGVLLLRVGESSPVRQVDDVWGGGVKLPEVRWKQEAA